MVGDEWAGMLQMAARSRGKPVTVYHAEAKQANRVSSHAPKKPYIISRDVQSLRQKKRVSQLLQTESFVTELEGILQSQLGGLEKPKLTRSDASSGKIPTPPPLPPMAMSAGGQIQVGGHTMGVLPINDLRGGLSNKYPLMEKQLRCKLAATYRLVDMFGMSAGIYNHITVSDGRKGGVWTGGGGTRRENKGREGEQGVHEIRRKGMEEAWTELDLLIQSLCVCLSVMVHLCVMFACSHHVTFFPL